jgi:hypothetical protein
MAKTQRRRQKKQKGNKRKIARTRKMRGGAFTQTEMQQLHSNGFSEDQIQTLQERNIPFNEVMERINNLWNQGDTGFHGNSNEFSEQIMHELLNEETNDLFDAIPQAEDDIHDLDLSFNGDDVSLHLSDLNVSQDSMRANTTVADESFNNSQLSDISLPSVFSENESVVSETGGKRRKRKYSIKYRKSRKSRKSRKQKGGRCFGNGVGANNYDPNYSIYNTNMLKLFPYKS